MARTHFTCSHCGFGVPADAPVCPGCRRTAVDGWRARARELRALERQARKERPPLHAHGYRSLLRRAIVSRATLTVTALAGVVTAALYVVWTFRVDDPTLTFDESALVSSATEIDIERVARWTTVGLLAVLALTGIAFIAWAVRAYRNLPALGIEQRRYWTIWLVVGWILPGANLLVPKLLVDDIWRASSPSAPIDEGATWQRRPVASIVNRWWCSFLLTPAIVVLGAITARGGLDDYEQQVAAGALAVLAAFAIVIAATAARDLIAIVTVSQARRADVIIDLREGQAAARESLEAVESALG